MNVLSMFDGISCGQCALHKAGVEVGTYYASEIDPHAIKVTQTNFPDTVQLGDVEDWWSWDIDWGSIDLVIGGSPCQGFSFAGKQLAFDDPRSKLFFTFYEVLEHIRYFNPNVKFLLENVKMKKQHLDTISEFLGVEPRNINSNLVSAQNRNRYYWANWEFSDPEDKGIYWGDIREYDAENVMYYSEAAMAWIDRHAKRKNKKLAIWADSDKCQMLEATMHKKYSSQRFFGIQDKGRLRYISVTECERAQTLPDGYCSSVSQTQAYRALGNGWTVDVVAHIFSFMEGEDLI